MSLLRTFIAIAASDEVRRRCANLIRRLDTPETAARWTQPQNLHHTLKFIGDTQDRQLADVCRAMARAAKTIEPFVLESAGVGAFPRLTSPRIVWVGAEAGAGTVTALHAALDQELYEVGFGLEARRFQPHLTLGRIRKGETSQAHLVQLLQQHAEFHAGHATVDEIILFSSRLEKDGPIYEALGRAPLGG